MLDWYSLAGPLIRLLDAEAAHGLAIKALRVGLDPVTAWRMASINTAEWFGLDRVGLGALAPGRRADILVLSDLESVERAMRRRLGPPQE